MKELLLSACLAASLASAVGVPIRAQQGQSGPAPVADAISLPAPNTDGGKPLMQVLNQRHTTREFSAEKLSPQVLSNLLWAAFGVNRTDGKRTAASAVNWQEMDIYVALPEGAYLYDARANRLNLVAQEDLRGATGAPSQPFVGAAALNLVYVADMTKAKTSPENQAIWVPADAGFIAQNVYLFCASEGLNVVVRGMVPREALAKALKLRPEQKIILAQTVGYPKK